MDPMTPTAGSAQASPSQTLSRGIRALEILAEAQQPLTIAELADAMGVHRSVAYRILRTLEDHSLLVRDDGGRSSPGRALPSWPGESRGTCSRRPCRSSPSSPTP